jgi:hypothetical protein
MVPTSHLNDISIINTLVEFNKIFNIFYEYPTKKALTQ